MKNKLKTAIREAKLDHLGSLLSCGHSVPSQAAEVWSYVNNMFGRNKSRQSPQPEIGSLNSINNHFQNVAITSDHQSPCNFAVPDFSVGSDPFVFMEIPVSVVLSHLQSLNPRKSTGPDGLSARFLKEVSAEIAPALTDLFNISLSSGVFPSEWKCSHITPIHKGGPSDDPSNFRPISVVPVLAKILEKIVSIQLSSYLEQRSLLHPHHAGCLSLWPFN